MKYFKFLLPLIILSSCNFFDPCFNVDCVYGDCVNGKCDCIEGYTGSSCELEKEPVKIEIIKIVVTDFPQSNPAGGGWDMDATGPDLQIKVQSGGNTVYTSKIKWDCVNTNEYPFYPSESLIMEAGQNIGISLYDSELFIQDTYMSGLTSNGELWSDILKGQHFPGKTDFTFNGLSFDVYWKYTH